MLSGFAQEMLLSSQRALPAAEQAGGYRFQHPAFAPDLAQLLAR